MPKSTQDDALSHAAALVVTPLVLGLFGWWLDGVLGTGWIVTATFVAFGIVGSVVSMYYRYNERMEKLDAGKPWTRRAQSGAQQAGGSAR